jgi:hypothetical protein
VSDLEFFGNFMVFWCLPGDFSGGGFATGLFPAVAVLSLGVLFVRSCFVMIGFCGRFAGCGELVLPSRIWLFSILRQYGFEVGWWSLTDLRQAWLWAGGGCNGTIMEVMRQQPDV